MNPTDRGYAAGQDSKLELLKVLASFSLHGEENPFHIPHTFKGELSAELNTHSKADEKRALSFSLREGKFRAGVRCRVAKRSPALSQPIAWDRWGWRGNCQAAWMPPRSRAAYSTVKPFLQTYSLLNFTSMAIFNQATALCQ